MRICVFYIFIPLIFSSNLLGQQATDESQELQLNLEQFPDEQFSTEELELNLKQFDQTDSNNEDSELQLNLEQFDDSDQNSESGDLELNLEQFDKESKTPINSTSSKIDQSDNQKFELHPLYIGGAVLLLFLFVMFIKKRKTKRRRLA